MKKLLAILLILALLFYGCTMSLQSTDTANKQDTIKTSEDIFPATSSGVDSSGEELPPLPPD